MTKMKLSKLQLRRATRLNKFWYDRLKYPIPSFWCKDVTSKEFALVVAEFQEKNNLIVDGILGLKTHAKLQDKDYKPKIVNLIISGSETCESKLKISHELKFPFDSYRQRKKPISMIVVHWNVTFSAHSCFNVLVSRNLSTHFIVDVDGTVYQTLDPVECAAKHAGRVNSISIGIDISNPVLIKYHKKQPSRKIIQDVSVNGSKLTKYLDFFEHQKEVALKLVKKLCKLFGIPENVPCDRKGILLKNYDDSIVKSFSGVCGHFHVSRKKIDPGYRMMNYIKRGFESEISKRLAYESE